MTTARDVALDVVLRVHRSDAYANLVLDRALRRSRLSEPDRALVTELTYGTLRRQGTLDWVLEQFAKGSLDDLPPKGLDILRLATYQLLYLDRVPAYAAVSEAVEQTKREVHKGLAGFANAVLRRIADEQDAIRWPDRDQDIAEHIAVTTSHPRWLVDMWIDELGVEEAQALCLADNETPRMTVRLQLSRTTRPEFIRTLRERGIAAETGRYLPEAVVVGGGGDITAWAEFAEGLVAVQEEASMLVAHVVDPRRGETVVDLCAGPGGKAVHLAELMDNDGSVVAVDSNGKRLKLVGEAAGRLGVGIIALVEGDATAITLGLDRPPERILVDAPCSGLGTLAHRPDARWRKSLEQIAGLALLQGRLLESAASQLAEGGVLVYSVCTIARRETEDVVGGFLKRHSEFSLEDISCLLPAKLREKSSGMLQLLPHIHGTDGMFIARLVKRG